MTVRRRVVEVHWSRSTGPAVADVGGTGGRAGVFDEDLAVRVDDGDVGVVGDHEDFVEAVLPADQVGHGVEEKVPALVSFLTRVLGRFRR